jgi:hypothetical protein
VYTLADDSMQGRETGTKGEQMAGLSSLAASRRSALRRRAMTASYLNAFEFAATPRTGPGNTLQLGRNT